MSAHVPVIWATQVLDQMAQTGLPSRAEVSDAALAARAECVMLNKGPHIVDAVGALDDILRRMSGHQRKKVPLLRQLRSWSLPAAPGEVNARRMPARTGAIGPSVTASVAVRHHGTVPQRIQLRRAKGWRKPEHVVVVFVPVTVGQPVPPGSGRRDRAQPASNATGEPSSAGARIHPSLRAC